MVFLYFFILFSSSNFKQEVVWKYRMHEYRPYVVPGLVSPRWRNSLQVTPWGSIYIFPDTRNNIRFIVINEKGNKLREDTLNVDIIDYLKLYPIGFIATYHPGEEKPKDFPESLKSSWIEEKKKVHSTNVFIHDICVSSKKDFFILYRYSTSSDLYYCVLKYDSLGNLRELWAPEEDQKAFLKMDSVKMKTIPKPGASIYTNKEGVFLKYGKEIFLHYDYDGNYLGEIKAPEGILEEEVRAPDGRYEKIWSEKPVIISGEYHTFKKEEDKYKVRLNDNQYSLSATVAREKLKGFKDRPLKGKLRFNEENNTLELWELEYRGERDSLGYRDLCIIKNEIKLEEIDTKKN